MNYEQLLVLYLVCHPRITEVSLQWYSRSRAEEEAHDESMREANLRSVPADQTRCYSNTYNTGQGTKMNS